MPSSYVYIRPPIKPPDKATRMRMAYHKLMEYYRMMPRYSPYKPHVWRKLAKLWNNDDYWPIVHC